MDIQDTSNYKKGLISYWTSRPQMSLLIQPLDNNVNLKVSISSNTISLQYVSGSTITVNFSYPEKSLENLVLEMSQVNLPVIFKSLSNNLFLKENSFIVTDGYVDIPGGFQLHDRSYNNSVIIRTNGYTIRHKEAAQISLKTPYLESPYLPWYPRIKNGSFQQRYENKIYHYSIPEYSLQEWSLRFGPPFKDVKGSTPVVIDETTIRLSRTPILSSAPINLYLGETPVSSSLIEDIDVNNGFVYFKKNQIITPEDIRIDYTYLEEHFEYKGVNINGHFNQNPVLIDKFVVIYIVPTEGARSISTKTSIRHVTGDSIEDAIQKIKDTPPIAILGAYNVQQVSASNDAKLIDTRVKGGGLASLEGPVSPIYDLESLDLFRDQISPLNSPYVDRHRFWDIDSNWDGEPYPGSAAVVLELPESYRDSLPISDIRNKSKKYMAAGIYPIFDFYNSSEVSNLSSNISCLVNGNFKEEVPGGAWTKTEYSVPNNTVFSFYKGKVYNNPSVLKENTHTYVQTDKNISYYQSYLKSFQLSEISWEERTVEYRQGNLDEFIYSEWIKKSIIDEREVPSGQLIKGFIKLDSNNGIKEYKNVKVKSPYRLDNIENLKPSVKSTIEEIYNNIDRSTPVGKGYKIPKTFLKSVDTKDRENIFPYSGPHFSSSKSIYLKGTEIDTVYNEDYTNTIAYIEDTLTGKVPDIYIPEANAILASNKIYNGSNYGLTADFKELIDYYSNYIWLNRNNLNYTTKCSNLSDYCSGLAYKEDYLCSNYYIDSQENLVPFLYPLGENYGYSKQEIENSFNQDHLITRMLPTAYRIDRAFSKLDSNPISGSLSGVFSNLETYLDKTYERFTEGIDNGLTYSGFSIIQSSYATFDRLGEFAGAIINDYLDSYEILYETLSHNGKLNNSTTPGIYFNDAGALNKIFQTVQSGLTLLYPKVNETILTNGILEHNILGTIKAYGRYCNLVDSYEHIFGKISPSLKEDYFKVYDKGCQTLLSNMVDEFGYVHETTYVDQKAGRFYSEVPSKVFPTLVEGIKYDKDRYLSYIYGIYTNVIDKYKPISGVFYRDSVREFKAGGKEFDILNSLIEVYLKL